MTAPKRPSASRTSSAAKANPMPLAVAKPQDHLPAKADTLEVPPDVTVEYHGHEYTIEGASLDDAELLEQIALQNHVGALIRLLGMVQWSQYKMRERDPETGRVTATAAAEFFEAVMKQTQRGNS